MLDWFKLPVRQSGATIELRLPWDAHCATYYNAPDPDINAYGMQHIRLHHPGFGPDTHSFPLSLSDEHGDAFSITYPHPDVHANAYSNAHAHPHPDSYPALAGAGQYPPADRLATYHGR